MERDKIWIVIPAYNEAKAIGEVVTSVRALFPSIVVVDDCSKDATREAAHAAGAHVVRHAINRDQGAALETGMRYALRRGAEIIIHFDADGQHRLEDIPALIEPIVRRRADVVLGSRFLGSAENIRFERRVFLRMAILFTWLFSGVKLSDAHNGFRALSRAAAQTIRIRERRKGHASEIIHEIGRHKLRVAEVPVTIRYTDYALGKDASSLKRVDSSLMRSFSVMRRLFWKQFFF